MLTRMVQILLVLAVSLGIYSTVLDDGYNKCPNGSDIIDDDVCVNINGDFFSPDHKDMNKTLWISIYLITGIIGLLLTEFWKID